MPGQAFDRSLREQAGIIRMAFASVPIDETRAFVTVDTLGQPYAVKVECTRA